MGAGVVIEAGETSVLIPKLASVVVVAAGDEGAAVVDATAMMAFEAEDGVAIAEVEEAGEEAVVVEAIPAVEAAGMTVANNGTTLSTNLTRLRFRLSETGIKMMPQRPYGAPLT